MTRLLEHFQAVCQRRLTLWGCSVTVELNPEFRQLTVKSNGQGFDLVFHPQACTWSLCTPTEELEGNFDRLTKHIRRVLTTSPVEEEAR